MAAILSKQRAAYLSPLLTPTQPEPDPYPKLTARPAGDYVAAILSKQRAALPPTLIPTLKPILHGRQGTTWRPS